MPRTVRLPVKPPLDGRAAAGGRTVAGETVSTPSTTAQTFEDVFQVPASPETEGEPWGLLFANDNPLVECANLALAALRESGELEAITTEWMSESAGVPEIPLD